MDGFYMILHFFLDATPNQDVICSKKRMQDVICWGLEAEIECLSHDLNHFDLPVAVWHRLNWCG